jgi:hypothetical protein
MTAVGHDARASELAGAKRGRPTAALTFHLGSLVVIAGYLAWTARGMTFVYDDWSFVVRLSRGDLSARWLLEPHNEHWVLLPKAVYAALHALFGFGSVWPYLAITLLLHLLLCHLLWRMAVRSGSDQWLASLGVLAFAVYAAGVENILWAFQIGLIGNMVLGTLTMLELGRPRPRLLVVAALSLLNVATSGIALVFLALAALLMVWQRRWRALWTLAPGALAYGAWYLGFAPRLSKPPTSGGQVALIPVYWLLGVGNSLASLVPYRSAQAAVSDVFTPVSALVALVSTGVLVFVLISTRRRPELRPGRVVTVFLLGCPLFVLLTSVSRISLGLGLSMASRYTYVGTAFLLPVTLCFLTLLTSRRQRARTTAVVAVAGLALANLVSWWFVADAWTAWSTAGTRVIAAGQQLLRTGAPVYPNATPDVAVAQFNPRDLLLDLPTPVSVTPADELTASFNMQLRFTPRALSPTATCSDPQASVVVPLPADGVVVKVVGSPMVTATLTDAEGSRSHLQKAPVSAGSYAVESLVHGSTLTLRSSTGELQLSRCTG